MQIINEKLKPMKNPNDLMELQRIGLELGERFEQVIEDYVKQVKHDIPQNAVGAALDYVRKLMQNRMIAISTNYFQLKDLTDELGLEVKPPIELPKDSIDKPEKK